MKPDLSLIVCILDRSGSMQSIARDAIGGFNQFIKEQKEEPGEALFSLVLFDDQYDIVHDKVNIQSVADLDSTTYVPHGSTALLDAMGKTIDDIGACLSAMAEHERPSKVIIAILTDGEENASHRYKMKQISKMIQHQREKYSWEFIFLAANQDAIATASSMSIDKAQAHNIQATPKGIREAHLQMSESVRNIRRR